MFYDEMPTCIVVSGNVSLTIVFFLWCNVYVRFVFYHVMSPDD